MGAATPVSDAVLNALKQVLNGTFNPLDPNVRVRGHKFHSRVSWPNANAGTTFKFFDTDPANAYVGNLKSTGLENDTVAILWSPGFKIESGYDLAGAAQAATSQIIASTMAAVLERMRAFYETAILNCKIGDWTFLEDQHGLYNFPPGGGVDHSPIATLTAAAASGVLNNGAPVAGNRYVFPTPIILLPGKRLRAQVDTIAAISPGSVDGMVLKMDFDATIITASNR